MNYGYATISSYCKFLIKHDLIRKFNTDGRTKKLEYTKKGVELYYLLEKIDLLFDVPIRDLKKESENKNKGVKTHGNKGKTKK